MLVAAFACYSGSDGSGADETQKRGINGDDIYSCTPGVYPSLSTALVVITIGTAQEAGSCHLVKHGRHREDSDR